MYILQGRRLEPQKWQRYRLHGCMCCRELFLSGAPTRPSPSAVNKQPAQPSPVAKTFAATMPRTIGRGLAAVKPHFMTLREAQNNLSLPPASSGTPCVSQPGAVGSLMSSPNLCTTTYGGACVPAPFGCSMEYKGSLPGHVDIPDIDDDVLGDQESSGLWLTVSKFHHRLSTPNFTWRMLRNSAPSSASASAKPEVPVLQMRSVQ